MVGMGVAGSTRVVVLRGGELEARGSDGFRSKGSAAGAFIVGVVSTAM
jgi:hypothetical protein